MSPDQETSRNLSQKRSFLHNLRTVRRVFFHNTYETHITPQDYEAHVERFGNRSEQANILVGVMKQFVPTTMNNSSQAEILDIAAGTAIISRALAQEGYTVTAIDLSQSLLDYLHEHTPSIHIQQADMTTTFPFKNDSYDGVSTMWANRYIADTNVFLSEVYRILKPGGSFIWPIYASERVFWKMRNGIARHTTPIRLMEDGLSMDFSNGQIIDISHEETRRRKIPQYSIPSYVILTK